MVSILFDCERMKYPNTGLFHFCLNLGHELLEQQNAHEEIRFYIPEESKGIFGEKASYTVKQLSHNILVPGSKDYRISVDSSTIDIWHMTYQTTRYRPTTPNTKVVLTIHDLNFLYEHPGNIRKRNKYLNIIQDRINRADHIVCISQYCLSDVKKYLDVAGKPISVVYNGVAESIREAKHDPQYKPSGKFLFTLGTVLPKKNFHVLPALLSTFDGELIVAGVDNHSYKNQIIAEAQKHNVADRLKFVGTISENDRAWYYKNCTAFLFPSIAEGFGLPPIEAMSHGKPTFLSTHTSLPEVGGPHAYYFKSFDPQEMKQVLVEGLKDYELRKPMADIKAWAGQFRWENAASSYWAIYRSLVTPKKIRLSAVIITFNEERNIARCLQSLAPVADEIIVIDSFSTDSTKDVCDRFGVRFVHHAWEGYSKSKNFANSLATGDYILSIDADEALSETLQRSIVEFKKSPTHDVYSLNRLTDYCGKWVRFGGWYPDLKKRLFKREIATWDGIVHEELVIRGNHTTAKLSGDMLHYSYPSVETHIKKSIKYAYLIAQRDVEQGKRRNQVIHGMLKPVFSFFKQYVMRLGFLDGYYGFVLACISSFELFMRYTFYKELTLQKRSARK
jgi:glycosyltransferase involved in cell wall biosynthesis